MGRFRIDSARLCLVALVAASPAAAQTGHRARSLSIVITVAENPATLPPVELCALPGNRRIALTTMWDDGPPSNYPGGGDLRMAHVLKTNGWKGTFGWGLLSGAIADSPAILADGMEVCSHTATHPQLLVRSKNAIFWEFLTSKIYFSVLTQRPVVSYADAYLAHDAVIDGELGQAGYLVGRGGSGDYSITNFSRRLTLPSDGLVGVGANEFRRQLDGLYASAPEGTVQGLWGHAYPPEFNEDVWTQFVLLLQDYAERADTWYATWSEVGSQMFLNHAARLGSAEIASNSVQYVLQLEPLPRDVQSIPLTLRITGTAEQLRNVSAVTVDGVVLPTHLTEGRLLFEVAPFAEDLLARAVTADLAPSQHPIVQQTLGSLPVARNPDLAAGWTWHEAGGVYCVDVSITNVGPANLESFALEFWASSAWNISTQMTISTTLRQGGTFQTRYLISPKPGANMGGWTAFACRIDYVSGGQPKTHYLFRDMELPVSSSIRDTAIGPNCQVAGPILSGTSNLADILAEAEGKWTDLAYDPSDRPTFIDLTFIYYPAISLSNGARVIRASIMADTAKQGTMRLSQIFALTGFKFWINGTELAGEDGVYPVALRAGVNEWLAICDTPSGIPPYRTSPFPVAVEALFCESDGTTPLSGISFTVVVAAELSARLMRDSAGRGLSLNWVAIPDKTYRVEFKEDFAAPSWSPLGEDRIASLDRMTIQITPTTVGQRFFRIVRVD